MTLVYRLIEVLAICAVTYVSWRVLRNIILKSPLDNIPGPSATSFWKGNYGELFHRHTGWDLHAKVGQNYNSVVKLHGLFGDKVLYVFDPKALQSVIVKDQYVYEEAPSVISLRMLVFGPGLLSTLGDWHRKQRKLLNPVFSINHMRHMTPIFYRVTHSLRDAITAQVKGGPVEVDILSWMGRTALELIGQGGLGYSFDDLVSNTPDEFGESIKALVPTIFSVSTLRQFLPFGMKFGTPDIWRRILEYTPLQSVQKLKYITDTMHQRSKDIFYAKKAALEAGEDAVLQQVGEGKDIMSILLKANMTASADDRLPESELIGQMSTLVFAAMDTTSNALSHIIHLLAEHQDAQEKVRAEIIEASDGQDIPYDQLVELPYLDAVCRETLRLYPPVTTVFRRSQRDGRHGGILESNRNKAIWGEDALEWKPERWLSPLPGTIAEARIPGVYSNLMTFIGGGRSCIGFKFSQLEMKVVLTILLGSFKFSLPKQEIVWNLAGVKYPTVGRASTKPSMPIVVERIRKE
ncbi:hypothetical protein NLI96_g9603 [Meripilus lineatus]|uniref:Cytochrome P450 n=1 Tax=Meripilus lineatus TaxID=2056292 RepID=A0AAD5UZL2_9APHY|nr:hypothetical protein NLI96_g9603 [Physisporinus lineatus]